MWETSQNPWVYRASELWDWATHETDTAVVLKELRKLDPNFSLEVSYGGGFLKAEGRSFKLPFPEVTPTYAFFLD